MTTDNSKPEGQGLEGFFNQTIHHLKCWPEYFEAIKSGTKTFEVRKNDRDYKVGHILILHKYDPEKREYIPGTSNLLMGVTYILEGGEFGIEAHYVIMGIKPVFINIETY